MNARKCRAKFKSLQIILDSGFSSTIVTVRLVETNHLEQDAVMQWHTQEENITTNLKVKVYFTLPALSTTDVVTWNFHVDDSDKGRYDMILGRYLSTELGLNLKNYMNTSLEQMMEL